MAAEPTEYVHQDQGARLVELNVKKARAIASWLDGLGVAVSADDRAALSADLSDLYVAATQYQSLLDTLLTDTLLTARPGSRDTTVDRLSETVSELQHAGDHIRSAVKRLNRLTLALDDTD